jgi:hypothetical protein
MAVEMAASFNSLATGMSTKSALPHKEWS